MRTRTLSNARRNEQIKKFRAKGWTLNRIAERYGLSQPRISQIINDPNSTHGVARRAGRPKGSKNKVA